MRRYLAAAGAGLALAAALSPLAAAPIAKDADLDIRLPPEETVAFRGVVSFDGAGGRTNSMLYQGGVVGLVAGVLTHAALESSAQQAERKRIQEAADKVLEPYAGVLRGYKPRELMERALQKTAGGGRRNLVEASAKPGGAALIEVKPIFFMTQDQSAIVLENELAIYAPGGAAEPAYRNVVKVVSEPKDAANLAEFWLANDGESLKQESAALMAESFSIALDDAAGAFGGISAPHKTVRYAEGKAEKMERVQILSARCDRLLVKTLRESLISVPVRKDADCSAPAK